MNALHEMLAAAAAPRRDEPFLTDARDGRVYSYGWLQEAAAGAAAALAAEGLRPGARVAYATRSGVSFYPLLFACARLGLALVPVNAEAHADEAAAVLKDSGAAALFRDPAEGAKGHWASAWRPADPAAWSAAGAPPAPAPADAGAEALIIYTSGTTGGAKGIVLTHGNLSAMSGTLARFYGYRPAQRFFCVLPFHHINAPVLTGLACLRAGAHVVLSGPFGVEMAKFYWDIAAKHGAQVLSLTPSIMASLLKLFPAGAGRALPSLEFGLVGTAALPEPLWRSFEETFGLPCYQGYGLTETTTWAAMTPRDSRKRYDSAGLPVDCEVRIEQARPGDSDGEVLIKGDIVMKGYTDAAATRAVLSEGWLRTGDVGRLEADGQLVIAGRSKNIVKRAGLVVFPEEIDLALRRHPGVKDCCTVGVRDDLLGERLVTAYVPASEGAELGGELAAFLLAALSRYKCPDEFVAFRTLPRTPLGKTRTADLRDIVSGARARSAVAAFTSERYRRAPLGDKDRLTQAVQRALTRGEPFRFVGYWGAGEREQPAAPERAALDRLREVLDAAGAAAGGAPAALHLLLADVHGRCNGVPPARMDRYFAGVAAEAASRGFTSQPLSGLWRAAGLEYEAVAGAAGHPAFEEEWRRFPGREDFVRRARRRGPDAEARAKRYLAILRAEAPVLAEKFAGSIFFTFAGPQPDGTFPDLPRVHWFSVKRGTGDRPWFLPDVNC